MAAPGTPGLPPAAMPPAAQQAIQKTGLSPQDLQLYKREMKCTVNVTLSEVIGTKAKPGFLPKFEAFLEKLKDDPAVNELNPWEQTALLRMVGRNRGMARWLSRCGRCCTAQA